MADQPKLSHTDNQGRARMVDVSAKPNSERGAKAQAVIRMGAKTLQLIVTGEHQKGDVLTVAKIAGIQAAKQCGALIPLCHPLALSSIDVSFRADEEGSALWLEAECKVEGKTGVEMEALTAVSVAALTIYDMCKAVDKDMVIGEICLLEKYGGRSGNYQRSGND